ncbi:hypothetical protein AAMO2058_000879400 [Amorphochlora amoebiformis]
MAALASPAKGVEFDVHTMTGKKYSIRGVTKSSTLKQIKEKINDKMGCPLEQQNILLWDSKEVGFPMARLRAPFCYCIVPPRWEVITSKQEGKGYRVWELFKDFRGEGLPSPPSASMLVAFKKKHSKKVIHWREGTAVDVGLVGQQDGVQRKSIFLALSFGGDRGDYFRYLDKKIHPESEN